MSMAAALIGGPAVLLLKPVGSSPLSLVMGWFQARPGLRRHPANPASCRNGGFSSPGFLILSPALCRDSERGYPVLQGHAGEDQQGPPGGSLPRGESPCFCTHGARDSRSRPSLSQ